MCGVSFTDVNNGTAVGVLGTIFRTTDGGENWVSKLSGTTNDLRGVSFTDANNGTAVGNMAQSSEQQTVEKAGSSVKRKTQYLFGVSFTDANNGTAVGYWHNPKNNRWRRKLDYQTSGTTDVFWEFHLPIQITERLLDGWGHNLQNNRWRKNWITQTSGITNDLWGVSFTDANNGTAVGIMAQSSEQQTAEKTGSTDKRNNK